MPWHKQLRPNYYQQRRQLITITKRSIGLDIGSSNFYIIYHIISYDQQNFTKLKLNWKR
jgi:hypothetical protein